MRRSAKNGPRQPRVRSARPSIVTGDASARNADRFAFRGSLPVVASFLILPAAVGLYRPAAAQDKVGINSAVNTAGTGTPPNAPPRELVIGQNVVFRERINTNDKGQTQILFLDESAMSVGPNSDLTIDEFVYDPKSNSGKLAMSATRGVFRYVGGKLSKLDGAVNVSTPVASIGIRGGAFLLRLICNGGVCGQAEIIFLYGKGLTITGRDGRLLQILARPGYAVLVSGPGIVSEPYRATVALVQALNAALDGRPGGSGGGREIPTDRRVALSSVGNQLLYYYVEPNGTIIPCRSISACSPLTDPGRVQTSLQVNTVSVQGGQRTSEQTTSNNTPAPSNNTSEPTPPNNTGPASPTPPQPPSYAGSYNSAAAGSSAGFAGAPTGFSGGSLQNGVFSAPVGGGTVTLSPLTPGTQTTVSGQTPDGPVSGTAFLSSDSSFFYANLSTTGSPSKVALVQGGIPITAGTTSIGSPNQVRAFEVQFDPALASPIPSISNSAGGTIPGATVSPLYLVSPSGTLAQDPSGVSSPRTLQASLAINGTGSSQQSVVAANIGVVSGTTPQLQGALRGSSRLSGSGAPTVITAGFASLSDGVGGGFYGSSGVSGIALGATSPFASATQIGGPSSTYNFNQPAVAISTPAGVGPGLGTSPSSGFIPSSGFFAGQINSTASSPYAITGNTSFSQTGPATFSASFNSDTIVGAGGLSALSLTFGGSPSPTPNSTIIDGNIYGATESATGATFGAASSSFPGTQQLYLLSAASAPPPASLLPGQTLCSSCAFTQWGYWGGSATSDFGGSPRTDAGHLNFWVAGQPTVTLPSGGSGTYNGNMIGSVNNAGAQYVATGNFTLGYNFGIAGMPGSGTFTINNFDGFTGITTPVSGNGGATFSGASGGFISSQVNGGFFGPTASETGGNFKFNAGSPAPYLAVGVFAGHQTTLPP